MLLPPIVIAMALSQLTWKGTARATPPRKPDPVLKVTVSPDLNVPAIKGGVKDEAKEAAYQKVADAINKAKIGPNNDRRIYFQNHPSPNTIIGWSGMIERVRRTRDGNLLVNVRVQGMLDGSVDNFYFNERYLISDQGVKYAGCGIHKSADQPYFSIGL